ncbi:hypothetical protein [Roseibacillus ishigakijimensis]|uniref:Uncharacterized protein n=1 Tax=Roseibacillus ishigakijimensis TaxID=454146 RepID=A0A934RSF1_9BACT|nr:hypothetical protein [Roseibacillus ishigakijimensis]MBK1834189.1 hypothetical protein [Roseibacillus ishigakijimensis]
MSDSQRTPLSARGAWAPFLCPLCRGLFRARTEQCGPMTCPHCQERVEVPFTPEAPAEEIQPLQREPLPTPPPAEETWATPSPAAEKASSRGLILAGLFVFSLLVVVGFVLLSQREPRAAETGEKKFRADRFETLAADDSPIPGDALLQLTSKDIEEAKEAALAFLKVEEIAHLRPLIRDPERVMPLIESYYQDQAYQAYPTAKIEDTGQAQAAKHFASFSIILPDYHTRPIAVEATENGYLVDWESWVGHGERPWKEFMAEKVTAPTRMRVTIQRSTYYNYDFQDERRWRCYELMRTVDEPVLFAYLPAESELRRELPGAEDPAQTYVVTIRYPDTPSSDNQVLLSDVIQQGWVLGL